MTDRVELSETAPGNVKLSGELTLSTLSSLLTGDMLLGSDASEVIVDLADISRVDSAGLALLIEWHNAARAAGRSLSYRRAPEKLKSLARVAGVDSRFA